MSVFDINYKESDQDESGQGEKITLRATPHNALNSQHSQSKLSMDAQLDKFSLFYRLNHNHTPLARTRNSITLKHQFESHKLYNARKSLIN
ncbi:hypothetical protein GCM10007877_23400 [Marinibactrum halimedae]|uniref:Uncharacterized protein n=1 Tax=Marinibactrum halimedae TaxID=1444977 RepID=A0AA37T4A1_9GAMM|nr:hypothetical protein GCM10007877_23400 [Marinibactrum halimedae]